MNIARAGRSEAAMGVTNFDQTRPSDSQLGPANSGTGGVHRADPAPATNAIIAFADVSPGKVAITWAGDHCVPTIIRPPSTTRPAGYLISTTFEVSARQIAGLGQTNMLDAASVARATLRPLA